MINHIENTYTLIHGGFFIICGIAFFIFAFRTRFWLPKYIHILALLSLAIGVAMMFMLSEDAPIRKEWGEFALVFSLFLPPAIVYFVFIFLGGQLATYSNRNIKEVYTCPFCGQQNKNSNICSDCGRYF